MVEHAHFGTTRYTTLSLSVIHVPGKPIFRLLKLRYAAVLVIFNRKKANISCLFNCTSSLSSKQCVKLGVNVSKMAKIAFILLCHKDPEAIIKQAERLTAVGDYMSIHFDARANPDHFEMIKSALEGNPNVAFAKKRIKCGWGEWSLVQATLYAVEAAVDAFPRATHFYMLSGDCMAIKSAEYAHEFLDRADVDYVESFDYFESDWIKTGMKEERLIYRHFFNERTQKRRF